MVSEPANILRGPCPLWGATVEGRHVIIRYRTRAGESGCWAECPSCRDVIDTISNDQ